MANYNQKRKFWRNVQREVLGLRKMLEIQGEERLLEPQTRVDHRNSLSPGL